MSDNKCRLPISMLDQCQWELIRNVDNATALVRHEFLDEGYQVTVEPNIFGVIGIAVITDHYVDLIEHKEIMGRIFRAIDWAGVFKTYKNEVEIRQVLLEQGIAA